MALSIRDINTEHEQEKPNTSSPRHTSHAAPPLDLSFKCLMSAVEITEDMDHHYQENLSRSPATNKYACNSVRLNNNSINDLAGFTKIMSTVVECIDEIAWIDLSFNELTGIDPVLLDFKNLKVLYLHGNTIDKFQEIVKLAALPRLISLTLHGNPIETERGYRQFVLSTLPGLKTLDFGAVTKQDRSTAQCWSAMHGKSFNKKRKNVNG